MKPLLISHNKKKQELDFIEENEWIHAPVNYVFEAITNSEWIDLWGGGPSKFSAKKGGKFFLWDGEIYGNVVEIIKPKKISLTLREHSWSFKWKDSYVVIQLSEERNGTRLILHHSQFPNKTIQKQYEDKWCEIYLGPLKAYVENLIDLENLEKRKIQKQSR